MVVCSQNHDQVGNRARGDRIAEHLDDDQLACAALMTLTSPFTPMLFQGEEWAASSPFAFFTDHADELGRAVSQGRFEEFAQTGWDEALVPDPQDAATFQSSKLDWSELTIGRHDVLLTVYRQLAELRRTIPELTDPDLTRTRCEVDEERRTFVMRRGGVTVAINFGSEPVDLDLGVAHQLRWATPSRAAQEGAARLVLPPHAGALLSALT